MFQYLKDNKNWIFSGIGVFILTLIMSGILYVAKTGNQQNDIRSPKMSEPTPQQICDTLDKLPPLQKEDIAKSYEGIKIDWQLEFNSANKNKTMFEEYRGKYIDIAFHIPGPNLSRLVWCWKVKLSDYPEFKVMIPGKMVRVRGIIGHIDALSITVENVVFSY